MFSMSKLALATRAILYPRLAAASLHTGNFARAPTLEEKAGIPPRPKKPLTPYFRYLTSVRAQYVKQNPDKSPTEIVQLIAKNWTETDLAFRQKFIEAYEKEKEVYMQTRAKYENKLTEEQKLQLDTVKQELAESRLKRAYKKKLRENNKPRKPASSFIRYLNERYAAGDRGSLPVKDFLKQVGQDWAALPKEKKLQYENACKAENEKYKQELAKWELKMVHLGNVDIVRNEALIEDIPNRKPIAKSKKSKKPDSSDSD